MSSASEWRRVPTWARQAAVKEGEPKLDNLKSMWENSSWRWDIQFRGGIRLIIYFYGGIKLRVYKPTHQQRSNANPEGESRSCQLDFLWPCFVLSQYNISNLPETYPARRMYRVQFATPAKNSSHWNSWPGGWMWEHVMSGHRFWGILGLCRKTRPEWFQKATAKLNLFCLILNHHRKRKFQTISGIFKIFTRLPTPPQGQKAPRCTTRGSRFGGIPGPGIRITMIVFLAWERVQ
jgi:hypothetical protein